MTTNEEAAEISRRDLSNYYLVSKDTVNNLVRIATAVAVFGGASLGLGLAHDQKSHSSRVVNELSLGDEDEAIDYETVELSDEDALYAKTKVADWINVNHPGLKESNYINITVKSMDDELNLMVTLKNTNSNGYISPDNILDFVITSRGVVYEPGHELTADTIPTQISEDLRDGFTIYIGPDKTKLPPYELDEHKEERTVLTVEGFSKSKLFVDSTVSGSLVTLIDVALS